MKKIIIIIFIFLFFYCSSPPPYKTPKVKKTKLPKWARTIEKRKIMTNKFFKGKVPYKYYMALYYEFPGTRLTIDQWSYGFEAAKLNKLNPLIPLIIWQKEQSLLEGAHKNTNIDLAMGFWREHKGNRGFKIQTYQGLKCLKGHYKDAVKNKLTEARLQRDDGVYVGIANKLNSAEYAHFKYNPMLGGNHMFRDIRIRIQKKLKKIDMQRRIINEL